MSDSPVLSKLEIIDIHSRKRREICQHQGIFEAPNWSRDGNFIIFNSEGALYKLPVEGGLPEKIHTGFANKNNNDHGISPDGKKLAISHHSDDPVDQGQSVIYIVPIEGGEPKRVTQLSPSYWHGWSPDGGKLVYVAGRANSKHYNIYSINTDGSEETRLTFTEGLDDGPDYSPCGNFIYYNSFQSGNMQIWRMQADGSSPTQIIESPHSDWFPHPSPNGKHLVFLRYLADQKQEHPFGKDVQLMLLNLENQALTALTDIFYGGQGSLNVPCWHPDSTELAFVSYQRIDKP